MRSNEKAAFKDLKECYQRRCQEDTSKERHSYFIVDEAKGVTSKLAHITDFSFINESGNDLRGRLGHLRSEIQELINKYISSRRRDSFKLKYKGDITECFFLEWFEAASRAAEKVDMASNTTEYEAALGYIKERQDYRTAVKASEYFLQQNPNKHVERNVVLAAIDTFLEEVSACAKHNQATLTLRDKLDDLVTKSEDLVYDLANLQEDIIVSVDGKPTSKQRQAYDALVGARLRQHGIIAKLLEETRAPRTTSAEDSAVVYDALDPSTTLISQSANDTSNAKVLLEGTIAPSEPGKRKDYLCKYNELLRCMIRIQFVRQTISTHLRTMCDQGGNLLMFECKGNAGALLQCLEEDARRAGELMNWFKQYAKDVFSASKNTAHSTIAWKDNEYHCNTDHQTLRIREKAMEKILDRDTASFGTMQANITSIEQNVKHIAECAKNFDKKTALIDIKVAVDGLKQALVSLGKSSDHSADGKNDKDSVVNVTQQPDALNGYIFPAGEQHDLGTPEIAVASNHRSASQPTVSKRSHLAESTFPISSAQVPVKPTNDAPTAVDVAPKTATAKAATTSNAAATTVSSATRAHEPTAFEALVKQHGLAGNLEAFKDHGIRDPRSLIEAIPCLNDTSRQSFIVELIGKDVNDIAQFNTLLDRLNDIVAAEDELKRYLKQGNLMHVAGRLRKRGITNVDELLQSIPNFDKPEEQKVELNKLFKDSEQEKRATFEDLFVLMQVEHGWTMWLLRHQQLWSLRVENFEGYGERLAAMRESELACYELTHCKIRLGTGGSIISLQDESANSTQKKEKASALEQYNNFGNEIAELRQKANLAKCQGPLPSQNWERIKLGTRCLSPTIGLAMMAVTTGKVLTITASGTLSVAAGFALWHGYLLMAAMPIAGGIFLLMFVIDSLVDYIRCKAKKQAALTQEEKDTIGSLLKARIKFKALVYSLGCVSGTGAALLCAYVGASIGGAVSGPGVLVGGIVGFLAGFMAGSLGMWWGVGKIKNCFKKQDADQKAAGMMSVKDAMWTLQIGGDPAKLTDAQAKKAYRDLDPAKLTYAQAKKAYRDLCLAKHPDKAGSEGFDASEARQAKDVLIHHVKERSKLCPEYSAFLLLKNWFVKTCMSQVVEAANIYFTENAVDIDKDGSPKVSVVSLLIVVLSWHYFRCATSKRCLKCSLT